MPAVYRSGNVLVFPTIEDVWGLVANEAILSGLPVLCSKYAGCAEELFPPESIFDPRNRKQFKRKLHEALAGRIAPADPSRLRTTAELAAMLTQALDSSIPGSHHGAAPATFPSCPDAQRKVAP
jgi:glycosyltransferase involved in cell wall biosynthesis